LRPKPLPTSNPTSKPDGFIDFAINRVRLKPQLEFLRATLFMNLLGETIIFDNLEHAEQYASSNLIFSCLIALAEKRILRNDGFEAMSQVNLMLKAPPCFAQVPFRLNEKWKKAESLLVLLRKRNEIENELKKLSLTTTTTTTTTTQSQQMGISLPPLEISSPQATTNNDNNNNNNSNNNPNNNSNNSKKRNFGEMIEEDEDEGNPMGINKRKKFEPPTINLDDD